MNAVQFSRTTPEEEAEKFGLALHYLLESANIMATKDNRCWPGYEPVKGKKPNSQGSCKSQADSKLKPSEKEFRGKRKRQLDEWAADHPKSPRSAAQHLAAPTKRAAATKKKSAAKKTALKK